VSPSVIPITHLDPFTARGLISSRIANAAVTDGVADGFIQITCTPAEAQMCVIVSFARFIVCGGTDA
jgi:hypothetical protein